ncbi:inorganic phosphate transporter [Microbulbifer sp. S227A]|uniref:inorganic phosphate transporter n=1 Tax=Microbulbifer sp. S227A TaxID=3415131 RepID=UPI003C7E44FD
MDNRDDAPRHLERLDRDLARYSNLETATSYVSRPMVGQGLALCFILLAGLLALSLFGLGNGPAIPVIAACLGGYMALNIGANDVANNMGPAVGAKALSMKSAIGIAVICECAGALLAGGDVASTIAGDIIAPHSIDAAPVFVLAMMAALLAAALWVNLATWIGAPVSTTQSIVGGVMGAGIAAAGFAAVNWPIVGTIAFSWILSPVLGGMIAALTLRFIKARIMSAEDKIAAARQWVPVLVGIMAGAFAAYLALKGLNKIVTIAPWQTAAIGIAIGGATWLAMIPVVRLQSDGLDNRNKSIKTLFGIPLVVSAALLSFAHGANDVANAVGPLAAIVQASQSGGVGITITVPAWVMMIGAFGISLGLFLFGPKLIRMVGAQITRLNPMRAYCVALSAAATVILASWLGLPVSSTYIAIGGVFGVGFFREWDAGRRMRKAQLARQDHVGHAIEERKRRKLVRRSHFMTIVAAWVITVPASATISALVFLLIDTLAH